MPHHSEISWLKPISKQIDNLIRGFSLPIFREYASVWLTAHAEAFGVHRDWWQQRDEFGYWVLYWSRLATFATAYNQQEEVRELDEWRQLKAPGPGWEERGPYSCKFPPHLAEKNEPPLGEQILPLPKRALTIHEKFSLLGAIRDELEPGERVFPDLEFGTEKPEWYRRLAWHNLRSLIYHCIGEDELNQVEQLYQDAFAELTAAHSYSHGTDYRSVKWYGTPYAFSEKQAPVIALLLKNFEQGTPDVGDETLLNAVDPEAPPDRLNVLFRDHPAWNSMIVAGATRGTHRLIKPTKKF